VHKHPSLIACGLFALTLTSTYSHALEDKCTQTLEPDTSSSRQYTFAWNFVPEDAMAPRGGTSHGPAVELVKTPSDAWQAIQQAGISKKERDRRAILAMAGPYRTSFDFIETIGLTPNYTPPAPYQSWGTEYVYVVESKASFISLQHILVMVISQPNGQTSDPIVVKHWRQDWRFEDRTLFTFKGHNGWEETQIRRSDIKGTWSQSVYQVDDSPRYDSYGTWQHEPNYSSWQSAETWRPLPRREFSVRDDYQALIGSNRHTITPTGWVQTEENKKVVLDGTSSQISSIIAVEEGLARYERIANHDWSAGDKYWSDTAMFWADVRNTWEAHLRTNKGTKIVKPEGKRALFMEMFALANLYAGSAYEAEAAQRDIATTLENFTDN